MRIATRGSPLARWQASFVASRLGAGAELVVVDTAGDRRPDVPLSEVGGQGVFVKEVQAAVLEGRADLAVHSAKDLPSATPEGLVLACVPDREDPRDALVGARLDDLPAGGVVATGSVRRRAQLAWVRPDLTFAGLRGNIATRLAGAGPDKAVVVAVAALRRLGLLDRAAEILPASVMLPQVAQGALAVECRAGDQAVLAALAAIDDPVAHRAVDAERGFLARLGGGCNLPVGALATVGPAGTIHLEGLLANLDGRIVLRATREAGAGDEPAAVGAALAAYLLEDCGGAELLAEAAVGR